MEQDLSFLRNDRTKSFIKDYEKADPQKLLLNPPKGFELHIGLLVDQLISRSKAKKKLPSWHQNPEIIFPPPLSVEQSSSETSANYKAEIIRGKKLLDLTGGMGVDCLSLSKNFDRTIYIERNEVLCELFRHNSQALSKENVEIHNVAAEKFLDDFREKATFFIDPARRSESKKVFRLADCEPNILKLQDEIREKAHQVLIKTSPLLDIKQTLKDLENIKEVHVVSVKNEVKEVLYLQDFKYSEEPEIIAINLESNHSKFKFNFSSEEAATSTFSAPMKFLYAPNSSILKAGAFKTIAQKFDFCKLDSNSHLYTSDQIIKFPGKVFRVLDASNKSNISDLIVDSKANIISRNHPLGPKEIQKKFKITDGGNNYLIATRSMDKPLFLYCELITF